MLPKPENKFVSEIFSDCSLILRDSENLSGNALGSIDENEISYAGGKGCIKYKSIEKIIVRGGDKNDFTFYVHVPENIERNERMKKTHPIKWALGLIYRDREKFICLGSSNTREDADILIRYLSSRGVKVVESSE